MPSLEEQAIQAALSGSWNRAIKINKQIVSKDSDNIDALNRLAYAHSQTGKYDKACTIYKKILSIEPYNPIANKNLTKCKQFDDASNKAPVQANNKPHLSPSLFVSDAQRTRIVQLVNVASKSVLKTIVVGEAVYTYRKGFELHIRDNADTYLGTLPDDIGRKLMSIIKDDDLCECFVKDINEHEMVIFIKWHE